MAAVSYLVWRDHRVTLHLLRVDTRVALIAQRRLYRRTLFQLARFSLSYCNRFSDRPFRDRDQSAAPDRKFEYHSNGYASSTNGSWSHLTFPLGPSGLSRGLTTQARVT